MPEGMKSAWELAMEKTERLAEEARRERKPLTPEQKAKISELEKEYEARIAEIEVMMQQAVKGAMSGYDPGQAGMHIEGLKQKFEAEKRSLLEEKQRKIESIKEGKGE